jgi:hypothetical protein
VATWRSREVPRWSQDNHRMREKLLGQAPDFFAAFPLKDLCPMVGPVEAECGLEKSSSGRINADRTGRPAWAALSP